MAAWLTVRDREFIGGRELLGRDDWSAEISWRDHKGPHTSGRRPDLVGIRPDGRPVAIEVELAQKLAERLKAILRLHASWRAADKTNGAWYVCGDEDGCARIRKIARATGARASANSDRELSVAMAADLPPRQPLDVRDAGRRARSADRLTWLRRRGRASGRALRANRSQLSGGAKVPITAVLSWCGMKLSEMKTNDKLIAEQLSRDPEFRAEWERTALARAVAVAIVRYRSEHELSQRELSERLGIKQPQVARLELGEVNPGMETLMRVSGKLGIEFTIDVRPAGTPVHNVTERAQANNLVGSFRTDEAEILVAAR